MLQNHGSESNSFLLRPIFIYSAKFVHSKVNDK